MIHIFGNERDISYYKIIIILKHVLAFKSGAIANAIEQRARQMRTETHASVTDLATIFKRLQSDCI